MLRLPESSPAESATRRPAGAKASADALRPELAPDVLAATERSAAAYRAQTGQAATAARAVATTG